MWGVRWRRVGLGWILTWVLFLGCSSTVGAQFGPAEAGQMYVAPFVHYFPDPQGELTLAEIVALPDTSWQLPPGGGGQIELGHSTATHWLAIKGLKLPGAGQWLLYVPENPDRLEVYVEKSSGGFVKGEASQGQPFNSRSFRYRDPVFQLPVTDGEEGLTLFIRAKHSRRLVLSPQVWPEEAFFQGQFSRDHWEWFYYGLLFAMAVHNLLLYMVVKERSYLYLGLVALSIGLNSMVRAGFAFQYFWPGLPGLNLFAYNFFTYLAVLLVLLFSREFLGTKELVPRADGVLHSLVFVTGANLILRVWFDAPFTRAVSISTNIVVVIVVMGISLYLWWARSDSNARLFVLVSALAAVGIIFDLMGLESRVFNDKLGLGLQMLLFSLALAEKINLSKWEREMAKEESARQLEAFNKELLAINYTLEAKVKERTAVLEETNELLQAEISERKQAEEFIRHMAYHDVLTDLPNRKMFLEQLNRHLHLARRRGELLAVMFLDLDDFKQVNDRYGHDAGDKLLCAVGQRLRSILRESDLVARIGGDEFTILAVDLLHGKDAGIVAEKVLRGCREPALINGQELSIKCSVGIGVFPIDGVDPDTLIKLADQAMYRAKAQGGNRYLFSNPSILSE